MNTTVDGLLSAIPIFQGLGPEALESLTAIGNIITLPPGTPVFAEGDPADCLYLILEGSVAVSKKDEGGTPHVVSSLAEGGCFGEMSLIGESVRDTTTRTTDQTTCFIISRDEFIRLLSEVPKLIPAIFASIIDKVASFNQKFLLELCEKQKLSDDLARERFRSISYIASMANEAPSTDQALRIVLDQLCEYIQWPVGHAYLRDNSMSDSLLSSRLWHVNDQEKYLPFVRASEMIRFEDGVGLPGCVFTRGKAVWVRDIAGDLVCPRAPEARKTGLVSAFAFPVFVDGELMAVLEFFSREKMEVDRVLLDATDQIGVQLGRLIERKNLEKQLEHNAFHDPLTGLPNRALFLDHLSLAISRESRDSSHQFAVLFIDLDRFKLINDSLGHQAGDQLLMEVAQRLQNCIRATDTVSRLGGDEFALLLDGVGQWNDVPRAIERIRIALQAPILLQEAKVFTTASIGVALSTKEYLDIENPLRDADTAMYRAKSKGPGNYQVFDQSMHESAVKRLRLDNDLRRALGKNELVVYYQPIVITTSQDIVAFEALIRWQHPEQGLLGRWSSCKSPKIRI